MQTIVLIPARYQSSRLPGKPLLKINDKTIIHHVYDNVNGLGVDSVVVLTDDKRIEEEVLGFGGKCEIITEYCLNGTDRIIHYLEKYNIKNSIIVNVQGDEPFINKNDIQLAIDNYKNKDDIVCSTLYYETTNMDEIDNKSRCKIVLDNNNNIMYCSRNIIPSSKTNNILEGYKYKIHIGIFVFDSNYLLEQYKNNNTPLQLTEDIEWLKIIEQGFKINSVKVNNHEIGIDTITDYNYLKNKYEVANNK